MTLISLWRDDFAALGRPARDGGRLAFFDSAASAQKPKVVVDALRAALEGPYANVHRGLYEHSALSTEAFEAARGKIAAFFNHSPEGTVMVRSATEGVNLIANTWGTANLRAGDVMVLTALEHHANIVPWQMLAERVGADIKVIGLNDARDALDMASAREILAGPRVKLLAVTQMSNVLGARPDMPALVAMAKAAGACVVVDGSQGAVHGPVDFAALGADFYVMTGHKLYGPNAVGAVLASPALLATLPPWQGGGDMIERVSFSGTTYADGVARFEAGTPAIAEVIALGAACDWVSEIGFDTICAHEAAVASLVDEALDEASVVRYGPHGTGIFAFNVKDIHPSDVAMVLDNCGVAVRTGHHCAMPLMEALGIEGCVRASVALYNDETDVERLRAGLAKVTKLLS